MSVYFSRQTVIVAPNERQALALWEAHAREQQARGETAWETLPACSWTEFLRALWEEYWLSGSYDETPLTLMNEWQERFLWIKSLGESDRGEALLNLPAAAHLAADAWKLTNTYRLEEKLTDPNAYWPEETRVFLGWVEIFRQHTRGKHWLESCRLEPVLSDLLNRGQLPTRVLPSTVRFVGFAEWTPSARAFLAALAEAGVRVETEEPDFPQGAWRHFEATHAEDEIQVAGRWLRRQLEKSPEARTGLVIPNLSQRRLEVSRLLTEVFQPNQFQSLKGDQISLCDFSVGLPLSDWPVVEHALTLLKLDARPQPLNEWALALSSPFVGEAETELYARAQLLRRLQLDGRHQVDWRRVVKAALDRETETHHAPSLGKRLGKVERLLKQAPLFQRPSLWASHFSDLLEGFGWPGQRSMDSHEYQTVARWKRTLGHLGSLDGLLGSVSREAALATLRRITDETMYQPKAGPGVVEVLGTLEAVGQRFDFLWLAGVHDGVWPAPSRPNPYLPFLLQREHQVSHSTPDRELEFARSVTQRLLTATRYGVASFPKFVDEQACRLSPLLSHLSPTSSADLKLASIDSLARVYLRSADTETVVDPGPPEVVPEEESRGGTSLFKHQAACPFRAFAYLRLRARPTEVPGEGLDPRQRGTMLHAALEKLWSEVRTHKRWLSLSPAQRERLLSEAAAFAVGGMQRERPDVLRDAIIGLERSRLVTLLTEWMELEAARAPFEVIATEERVDLNFAGLSLRATIDRVDRLHDGTLAVIDYKTGSARVADWLGERPREPQLPLYSVAHPRSVNTICFAVLKTGKMGFFGLASDEDKIEGARIHETLSWNELQTDWHQRLESLAREFRRGVVRVDPLEGDRSCQYCRLEPLCRVDERNDR